MVIETERLIIKPVTLADANFVLELYNCALFKKFVGDRQIHTLKDAETYIKNKMLSQIEKLGYGNNIVMRKEDNVKVGNCGIFKRDGIEHADIGFSFLAQHHKKGYAFESANMVLKSAFETHQLQTINAITVKENINSQNLIKKLGLTYQKMIKLPNDPANLILFELTKEDYLKL